MSTPFLDRESLLKDDTGVKGQDRTGQTVKEVFSSPVCYCLLASSVGCGDVDFKGCKRAFLGDSHTSVRMLGREEMARRVWRGR